MQKILFACFLSLSACSAPDSRLHADVGKLRPWSADLDSEQPLPPPFVADFESGARSLCYAALTDGGESDSPSLLLLRQVMESRRFKVIVLEGIPRSMGMSPNLPLKNTEDNVSGYYLHDETTSAIAYAIAKKISFVGAEPDEEQLKSAVVSAGFSVRDLFGLHILRLVPEWRLDGTLTRGSFEKAYGSSSRGIGARLHLKPQEIPTYEQFLAWYEAKQGTPFHIKDVRTETVAPLPEGTLMSQRIATVIDRVRSEHILNVTDEMLNRFGQVLLVFHGEHFPVQEPALEAMLGQPVRISDEP